MRIKQESRELFAAILLAEPSARAMFNTLCNLGAENIRHDYMLCRNEKGSYDRYIDPCVWYANCRGGLFVAMVRHGENDWTLHS